MEVLGTAYLLGLSVAAVLGPINLLAIRTGLQRGFRAAFLVGLGATAADGFYTLLAALGAAAIVGRTGVRIPLWLLGSGVLAYLGGSGLLRSLRGSIRLEGESAAGGAWGVFLGAFAATLGNPMTVASWAAVFGGLYAGMVETVTTSLAVRLVAGVAAALSPGSQPSRLSSGPPSGSSVPRPCARSRSHPAPPCWPLPSGSAGRPSARSPGSPSPGRRH